MTHGSGDVHGRAGHRGGAPVALVTGGTAGAGAAVARRLAAEGMRVVVNMAHGRAAGEVPAAGLPDALYVAADIAVRAEAEALVAAAVRRHGRLDVLVNSLDVPRHGPRREAEEWREFFDVDVVGTWQMCLAALPQLRAGGAGRVVNVGAVADARSAGGRVPRAVSQAAALTDLTRLLAAVTGPRVRVDAVVPGLADAARAETCEEVAEAVYALLESRSDGTDGVTGARRLAPALTAPRASAVRSAGALRARSFGPARP
ncbi:SDR family oxidoreductase [Streptomyces sp. NPDC126514]|uniref:SDR family NAD(P)-dependent oxidoreductase n=1 Tax=Streptomyces sp. NPDC126514 TaxID=3155210 RepID=UPI00332D858C